MKITNFLALGICLLFGSCTMQKSTVQVNDKGTEWEWNKGTIVVKTPERLAGQESVIGLALPKMEVVRVGFVAWTGCCVTFHLHSWHTDCSAVRL